MNKTEAMIEKVKALADASSCCAEAKEAANNWLAAVNTEKQDEAAKALIEEIAADIIPIDGLIAFAGSEDGKKIFGAEKAAGIEAHRRSRRRADSVCPHVAVCDPTDKADLWHRQLT
ncbi:MAG: molecular chaperone Hsp90 [Clostridium sp.]